MRVTVSIPQANRISVIDLHDNLSSSHTLKNSTNFCGPVYYHKAHTNEETDRMYSKSTLSQCTRQMHL